MIKKLQNKKVVNPQSKGGSTMGKLSLNTVWTKAFIIFFLFGFWRVGEGQTTFIPGLPSDTIGSPPVIINTTNPVLDTALITDGQVYFNSLNTGTLLINFLGRDGTGKIYEQQGSLPDLGMFAGQTLYWNGGVSWLPTDLLHVDPSNNIVRVGISIPSITVNYKSDPIQGGPDYGWEDVTSTPPSMNPIFSVGGGDIETNGNIFTSENVYIQSDRRIKNNINELHDWKRVLNLNAYSYNYVNRSDDRLSYGFIAQDVLKVLPELTATWREAGAVNYIGFIPFLFQGLKDHEERLNFIEQTKQQCYKNILDIEKEREKELYRLDALELQNQVLTDRVQTLETDNKVLENKNEQLENRVVYLEDMLKAIYNLPCIKDNITPNSFGQTGTLTELPTLEQNEPNPFSETTIIRYFLPEGSANAKIEVRNGENKVVGSFPVSQFGHNNITISAGTLSAGNYFYSLIINGNTVETKKMILLK